MCKNAVQSDRRDKIGVTSICTLYEIVGLLWSWRYKKTFPRCEIERNKEPVKLSDSGRRNHFLDRTSTSRHIYTQNTMPYDRYRSKKFRHHLLTTTILVRQARDNGDHTTYLSQF